MSGSNREAVTEYGESYTLRNVIICAARKILLGRPNQDDFDRKSRVKVNARNSFPRLVDNIKIYFKDIGLDGVD
jgi:hypothetical protein